MPGEPGPRRGAEAAGPGVVRARLWVSGRVQGVGFRFFVQRQAEALGLGGVVRNLPDRRVEVQAEGPPEAVRRLIEAVRQGPPGAAVTGVEVRWETPVGESGFSIRTGGPLHD